MNIASASFTIHHLISNPRSWNKCLINTSHDSTGKNIRASYINCLAKLNQNGNKMRCLCNDLHRKQETLLTCLRFAKEDIQNIGVFGDLIYQWYGQLKKLD